MRMTSPEKLILENQSLLLMTMSLVARLMGETITANALSGAASKTLGVLHDAKTWPEEQ